MMKTTVHIISHSHWDREWYQSFETHRMKLIELVDNILDKAENDPEFGGFSSGEACAGGKMHPRGQNSDRSVVYSAG